ncbi:MAG: hypothetical protein L0L69_09295, partial [Propionibacterium sp.]|nr:hypothetical protein [Propionibacterium sp.]
MVATAGLLKDFARAGASSTNLVAAGIVATCAGGVALGGARWVKWRQNAMRVPGCAPLPPPRPSP